MLPYRTIDGFLKFTDPGLREIVLELRNIVAQVAPGSTEDIRHGGIVYYFEGFGGLSQGISGGSTWLWAGLTVVTIAGNGP